MITDEVFAASLRCPTKSHLEYSKCSGVLSEVIDWQLQLEQSYRASCRARWASKFEVSESPSSLCCIEVLKSGRYPLLINSVVGSDGLRSNIDMLERTSLDTKRKWGYYIPIRMIPREKLTRDDKYLLAFDALTLTVAVGKVPEFGKIIHGGDFRTLKIKLPALLKTARSIVEKIARETLNKFSAFHSYSG